MTHKFGFHPTININKHTLQRDVQSKWNLNLKRLFTPSDGPQEGTFGAKCQDQKSNLGQDPSAEGELCRKDFMKIVSGQMHTQKSSFLAEANVAMHDPTQSRHTFMQSLYSYEAPGIEEEYKSNRG